jgi:hypothetical protein
MGRELGWTRRVGPSAAHRGARSFKAGGGRHGGEEQSSDRHGVGGRARFVRSHGAGRWAAGHHASGASLESGAAGREPGCDAVGGGSLPGSRWGARSFKAGGWRCGGEEVERSGMRGGAGEALRSHCTVGGRQVVNATEGSLDSASWRSGCPGAGCGGERNGVNESSSELSEEAGTDCGGRHYFRQRSVNRSGGVRNECRVSHPLGGAFGGTQRMSGTLRFTAVV